MKKIKILVCLCFLTLSTSTFAQLKEVKGVETKWVVYNGTDYYVSASSGNVIKNEYFGYSFTNINKYDITIESELWVAKQEIEKDRMGNVVKTSFKEVLVDTKTFVLQSNEEYVWKHNGKKDFQVYIYYSTVLDKVAGDYFIKFKAYKNE